MTTRRLFSGKLTMAEVAVLAGVSKPTVSKVLNGQPGVAAATRERVERVISERGYVRNRAARALSAGRAGSVELVMIGLDSPYFVEIIQGVEGTLERAGLSLVLTTTQDDARRHQQWLARVIEHGTDGAILVLPDEHAARLGELRRRGIPFVVVDDRGERRPGVPSVGAANFAGGRTAAEHLISLGHRRIAAIGGPPYGSTRERLAGYQSALQESDKRVDPLPTQPGSFMMEAGYAATSALLDLPSPPTAIFAGNDMQAVGVYKALYARGLRVPDDVSVVGFDDVSLATLLTPALSTVRQPLREMGALATRMLLRLIAGEGLESTHVELPTSLVVRDSCAPPRR